MANNDDIQKLSQQFLDLWQRQLTASMKNPEMVGSMLQMMHTMQQQMGNAYGAAKNTAPDTDLSEPGNDELLELDRRIRAVETRLDQLESGAKNPRKKS